MQTQRKIQESSYIHVHVNSNEMTNVKIRHIHYTGNKI
jgi:hypothetical protein